jgi:hypothetical protein
LRSYPRRALFAPAGPPSQETKGLTTFWSPVLQRAWPAGDHSTIRKFKSSLSQIATYRPVMEWLDYHHLLWFPGAPSSVRRSFEQWFIG